jgi:hypothetical protein
VLQLLYLFERAVRSHLQLDYVVTTGVKRVGAGKVPGWSGRPCPMASTTLPSFFGDTNTPRPH